jgi:anaerobic magnesium-protoporphyrin IX monomethyl ester cyclase
MRQQFVALVHPPQQGLLEGFSSGLISLADYVTKALPAVRVSLLDFGLSAATDIESQLRDYLQRVDGQLFVGVSTTTASYQSALQVVRIFKALAPTCVTVLGGHHASAQADVVLRTHHTVDYVICGEGERSLVEFLKGFPEVGKVPGLAFRTGLGTSVNEACPPLDTHDLDDIAPSFNGTGLRSAPGKFDHTTYVSARGCPLRCAFCAVSGEPIRCRSVSAVIRDLRWLVGEKGYRSIAIEDNHFAQSPQRTIELCSAIEQLQRELPFRWDCQTRVESCRPDVLTAMEQAGCEAIYLGVEALDPEQLLYLSKTRTPGDYVRSLRDEVVPWLLRSSIDCYLNLQLGLPAEGEGHRTNTLAILQELGTKALEAGKQIVIFPQLHVVYPGTRHHEEAKIEGRLGPDAENVFERFTAWEARQQPILRWLGQHFAHGTGGIPEGILCPDRLRRGEFEVSPTVVLEVINYLEAMRTTPGLRVFNYSKYLAGRLGQHDRGQPLEQVLDGTVPRRS